jgi:hypothetical protein
MAEPTTPNVAEDLLCIHAIITRGLNVSAERGRAFAREGYPDAPAREGFVDYVRSLVAVLHAHHLTESDVVFPSFRAKVPDAPFDLLLSQHRDLEPMLQQANAAIDEVSAEPAAGAALARLIGLLDGIAGLWHPHIRIEEDHFSLDRIAALFDAAQHEALNKAAAGHSAQLAGPDYLVVPFLLHNLEPDKRRYFSRSMPPIVTEQLLPVVWKQKWAPMLPFLLP